MPNHHKKRKQKLAKPVRAWCWKDIELCNQLDADCVILNEPSPDGLFDGTCGYVPVSIREIPAARVKQQKGSV